MASINIVDPKNGICWTSKSILTYIMNNVNTVYEDIVVNYDRTYFVDELFRRLVVAFEENNTYLINTYLCLDKPIMGKCPALAFVVYHQHVGLTEYVLSKITANDISQPVFKLSCEYKNINIMKMLCEKDPHRFYMKINKKGEYVGKIRSLKERTEIFKV